MRLPSIFNRYLCRNFLLAFLCAVLSLAALIFLFDVIDLLRRASTHEEVTFTQLINLALLKLPSMVGLILPFAVLIGALVTFYRLSKSNELVIARSAGLSVWNFLRPVLIVTFVLGLVNVMAFNPFSAFMHRKYEVLEQLYFHKKVTFSLDEKGFWMKEKYDGHSMIIHANSVQSQKKDLVLKDVLLLQLNDDETFHRQIEAKEGRLTGHTLFVFGGISFDEQGQRKNVEPFSLTTELDLKRMLQVFESLDRISFWKLWPSIRSLNNAGLSSLRHRIHFFSLIASIFYLISMVLIAAVFSLSPNQRQGGALIKISGAFLFGFLLFFLSKLTTALGMSGALPIGLATFGPSIIMACLCLSVLLKIEDG